MIAFSVLLRLCVCVRAFHVIINHGNRLNVCVASNGDDHFGVQAKNTDHNNNNKTPCEEKM